MPIAYTKAIGREICTRIVRGEAIVQICKDKHLPTDSGFLGWLAKGDRGDEKYVGLVEMYARARQSSADVVESEIMEIERGMLAPKMIDNPAYDAAKAAKDKDYSEPPTIPNPDHIETQAGRETINSKKWRAARRSPRVYGDSVEVKHSGRVQHDHVHKVEPPDWMKERIDRDRAMKVVEPPTIDQAQVKNGGLTH